MLPVFFDWSWNPVLFSNFTWVQIFQFYLPWTIQFFFFIADIPTIFFFTKLNLILPFEYDFNFWYHVWMYKWILSCHKICAKNFFPLTPIRIVLMLLLYTLAMLIFDGSSCKCNHKESSLGYLNYFFFNLNAKSFSANAEKIINTVACGNLID